MLPRSTLPTLCKLSISAVLAAWCCVWILKPTRFWKKTWHQAEDWADGTFLCASGLNVIVFCFPLLVVAVMGYIYLYLCDRERRIRKRRPLATYLSNPLIVTSPVGILSSSEVIAAALFVSFLVWTYYSNVSSDLNKLIPSKSLILNRWQLKVMAVGVRFGSLTEACLVLLLLPVLRRMSVFNICDIHFEASVRYHVWLGNAMMIFSVLHSSIIMFVWGSKNSLWMQITKWQRTGRVYLAGAITLVAVSIIWITSLPPIRRKNFQFFYFSHHLYVLFFIFFLLHAGAGHFYLVLSGVLLFAIDKLLRILQSRRATCLISARVLPCNAIELTIPKDQSIQYTPTSTLFVKVPAISKFQWHPFSITSSSNMENDRLSFMVKCQGPWTNSFYDMIQAIQDYPKSLLQVAVEGPYGPANFPYRRYNSLVLVAGGSGITPFLSILQDVASGNGRTNNYPKKIELIYAVKKSQDLSMLTPISALLLNRPADLVHVKLRLFVTQEEEGDSTTVGEVLHEMSQVKSVILDQSYGRDSIGKPEGLLSKAIITGLASLVFLVSLVCLTHVFIHQRKRSSQNKTPSWISDVLIVCCFIIATSFSIAVTMLLSKWRMSLKDYRVPPTAQKNARSSHTNDEMNQDFLGKNEISYGKRPNLTDILLEHSTEGEESNVGVFVCGPDSLQESVASFCRKYSRMCGKKNKCFYSFHSINFSL